MWLVHLLYILMLSTLSPVQSFNFQSVLGWITVESLCCCSCCRRCKFNDCARWRSWAVFSFVISWLDCHNQFACKLKFVKFPYIKITLVFFYKKRYISPITGLRCPEGSSKLRFPDYMTMAQNGGKVVSLMHQPFLPPGNTPGTHFC